MGNLFGAQKDSAESSEDDDDDEDTARSFEQLQVTVTDPSENKMDTDDNPF